MLAFRVAVARTIAIYVFMFGHFEIMMSSLELSPKSHPCLLSSASPLCTWCPVHLTSDQTVKIHDSHNIHACLDTTCLLSDML